MAEDKTIRFVVVTPERQALEEAADFVVIPAHDGEIGVLSDRAPLMCELGIGQMRYQKAGATHRLFVDGGFAQVLQNDVTVLTANAVLAEEITSEMITEAERSVEAASGHAPAALEARHVAECHLSALRNLQETR